MESIERYEEGLGGAEPTQMTVSTPLTTAKLKALSNPIRRDILHALTARRYARATDLASDLGLPSNKIDHQELVRKVVAMASEYMQRGDSMGNHGTFMQTSLRLTESQLETAMKHFTDTLKIASEGNDPSDDGVRLWRIDLIAGDDTL